MKALFFRKCSCADEYMKLFNQYPYYGQELNFEIVKTINLKDQNEYDSFTNNFLADNEEIKKMKDCLFIDNNDCVHCAFFTLDGNSGFLVYSSGYDYARYVAFYQLQYS